MRRPFIFASREVQPPFSHFAMKLFFAAPESGLPSALTALVAHKSAMHFFMKDVFAAPARGLPSLPTALLSQVSCAKAAPPANVAINAASNMPLIISLSLPCLQRLKLTSKTHAIKCRTASFQCEPAIETGGVRFGCPFQTSAASSWAAISALIRPQADPFLHLVIAAINRHRLFAL